MGADIKALRSRIKSVDSTLHLTKAMGLVASSKIRKANTAMANSRDYSSAVRNTVEVLGLSPECAKSPYMRESDGTRTKIIVIAGDRGLAGGYNANVFRLAGEYPDAEFIPIGKRACERFGAEANSSETFSYADSKSLCDTLCKEFREDKFDRLGIISTKYVSMMTQEAQISWVLPIKRSESQSNVGVIFEPDEMTVLNTAVPEYVAGILIASLRESFASEVVARRMAMDSAGKNAQQMIDSLLLEYNRARQGTITQEITEIVAGSGT